MNRIAAYRKAEGLSQRGLALKAGISYRHEQALEFGESQPTLPIARRLAAALNATVEDLWPPNLADEPPAASGAAR